MSTNDSNEHVDDLISQAVEVWGHRRVVSLSMVGRQSPTGYYLAKVLSERPESEAKLGELLSHNNQIIVAYSLIALKMMDSALLGRLPKKLLDNKQLFTVVKGSFGEEYGLGEYAREIQQQWQQKHHEE